MTKPDEFAALRAALKAGPTPGPWSPWGKANPSQVISAPETFVAQTVGGHDEVNAAYIAACSPEVIARLLAELDAARADAERWRWLRQLEGWPESEAGVIGFAPGDFDAMADAAMKAKP